MDQRSAAFRADVEAIAARLAENVVVKGSLARVGQRVDELTVGEILAMRDQLAP